jgi:hypothetical protein
MRIKEPQQLSVRGINSVNDAVTGRKIKHSVNLDRLRRRILGTQIQRPGKPKLADIGDVDLGERTVMLLAEGSAIARPVAAVAAVEIPCP